MIERVVSRCLQTGADKVYVVTDDDRVRRALRHTGVAVVMSDPDIATGTDRVAFVAKDLADDVVINVQGDEPFIPPALIDGLISELGSDKSLKMNTACTKFEDGEDVNNPAQVKVVLDNNGYALYFSRLPIPCDRDLKVRPVRYRHIGIYGFRREFLLKYAAMPKTPLESSEMLEQLRALENGERIKVIKTEYKPVSVDTVEDLINAEKYLKGV